MRPTRRPGGGPFSDCRGVPFHVAVARLPEETLEDDHIWQHRYRSINDVETHLHQNGTRILKFFLHLSKEEQRRRFLARIDDSDKNWKFRNSDMSERKLWQHYMRAYEQCLSATSTEHAPWYCVPADDKQSARLIISQVLLDTLDGLNMRYPDPQMPTSELQAIRKKLAR